MLDTIMKTFISAPGTPISKKHFWLAAYLAALHRLPSAEALTEADQALIDADKRWAHKDLVADFRFTEDYEIGHVFPAD